MRITQDGEYHKPYDRSVGNIKTLNIILFSDGKYVISKFVDTEEGSSPPVFFPLTKEETCGKGTTFVMYVRPVINYGMPGLQKFKLKIDLVSKLKELTKLVEINEKVGHELIREKLKIGAQ